MEPIGLTMKDITYNPFTERTNGELMIVHRCIHCGRISCNRIAGDDSTDMILSLLKETSSQIGTTPLMSLEDKQQVVTCLFGYGYEE